MTMAFEAFSHRWAQEWCGRLNANPEFEKAAQSWEGSVALVMTRDSSAGSPLKAVFLDLGEGSCRSAREASPEDLETARFVLSGTVRGWRDVLTGQTAPLMAMMNGKIRLTRGGMGALAPYAAAARELVATAIDMPISFPEGW